MDIESIHNDDKIWDALERVDLKEAVSAMPEKLDTVIEDGGSLSRGQVIRDSHTIVNRSLLLA